MGFLVPESGRKSATGSSKQPAIIVNGKSIKFTKPAADEIGIKDHVNLFLGEGDESDRLYFLKDQNDQPKYKVNGQVGKPRYFTDGNVVTIARLNNDTYPLEVGKNPLNKNEPALYVKFNKDAPLPPLTRREPKARTSVKEFNKAIGDQIKANKADKKTPAPAGTPAGKK